MGELVKVFYNQHVNKPTPYLRYYTEDQRFKYELPVVQQNMFELVSLTISDKYQSDITSATTITGLLRSIHNDSKPAKVKFLKTKAELLFKPFVEMSHPMPAEIAAIVILRYEMQLDEIECYVDSDLLIKSEE